MMKGHPLRSGGNAVKRAAACAQNVVIEFDPRPYRSVEEALGALKAGEVDCLFPLHMSAYDSEEWGVYVTGG